MSKARQIISKILHWLAYLALSLILIFALLVFLVRIPYVQTLITQRATDYISEKTGAEASIGNIFLTYSGGVEIKRLYLSDSKLDTLIYFTELNTGVAVMPLLGGSYQVKHLRLTGLRMQLIRGNDSLFNYQYLIDAFSSPKDTSTSQKDPAEASYPELSAGPIELSNCRYLYIDSVAGLSLRTAVDELAVIPDQIDLEQFKFSANQIALDGSDTEFSQFKSSDPDPQDTSSSPLPEIAWKEIAIENSHFKYNSRPAGQQVSLDLEALKLADSRLMLADSVLEVGKISINGFNGSYLIAENQAPPDSADTSSRADSALPAWQVDLAGIELSESSFKYDLGTAARAGNFDPNHLQVDQLQLKLGPSHYDPEQIRLDLEELALVFNQNFYLDQLALTSEVSQQNLLLEDFRLTTTESDLGADLKLSYQDLNDFIKDPTGFGNLRLQFAQPSHLDLKDVLYFLPELDSIPEIKALATAPIYFSGALDGKLAGLNFSSLEVSALNDTRVALNGILTGLPETTSLGFANFQLKASTGISDLEQFIDTSGISLPANLTLTSELQGDMDQLRTNFDLTTSLGQLVGQLDFTRLLEEPGYQGQVSINNLEAGALSGTSDLGMVSAEIDLRGRGTDLPSLYAEANLAFSQLEFRGYNYKSLALQARLDSGNLQTDIEHKSNELVMQAALSGTLDSSATALELQLNLGGARLSDLNLMDGNYKLALKLQSRFEYVQSVMKLEAGLQEIMVVSGQESYRVDSIYAEMRDGPDSSFIQLDSDLLIADVQSNSSLQKLVTNLSYHSGISRSEEVDTSLILSDFNMNARCLVTPDPLLTEILLPELEYMDTIRLEGTFKPESEILQARVSAPLLSYSSRSLEGLKLNLNTSRDSGNLELAFSAVSGPFLNIGRTDLYLSRNGQNGKGRLHVLNQEEVTDYHLDFSYLQKGESQQLQISPDSLILNENPWNISRDNLLRWDEKGLNTENFVLSYQQQKLELLSQVEKQELAILFNQFDLSVLFGLLNNQQDLISGSLNGRIDLVKLQQTPGFIADLNLNQLALKNVVLGDLSLLADNSTGDQFDLDLKLQGPEVLLTAQGNYNIDPAVEKIDLQIALSKLELPLLEKLLPEQLDSTNGKIEARLDLTGNLRQPDFNGELVFKDAGITPVLVGSHLRMPDERLSLNNTGLSFNDFRIIDSRGNQTVISGTINTEDPLDPAFDVSLKAQNFQLLSAEEGSNNLYYGQILTDLDIKLTGSLNEPVLRSSVTLRDETDFTYIVPSSQAQIESRSGIVVFQNMQDTLDIMDPEEGQTNALKGYDIESRIILRDGTQLRMLLDPRSGDNMTVKGAADLNFTLSPNGNMNLTGRYELNGGGYKLNLYDLVKKEFNIRPGSQIVWTGDPMGADLNITGIYETKTSAASLMDDPDPRFNRSLPFQVLLFIKGTIEQPEISFKLDMAEDARASLGGDVYSKLRQVNDDESELNKQVFALIVFDRFIPSSESGDASVSTGDIARSSVSDFLSGQLNNLSDRYLKGVELNVNIESYTDYGQGSGQERTDLNLSLRKAFFDDRVVLEVGSNMALEGNQRSNEVIGDVAIEYLLTEEGTYRLRGYRRNDYQSPVEGEVIITGLALIFSREFNGWDELFKRPKPEEDPTLPQVEPEKEDDDD